MPCPLCGVENQLPANGVGNLPKNIFIRKLIKAEETDTTGDKQVWCDACRSDPQDDEESVDINFAEEYCVDCKLKLCRGCMHIHRRSKANRSHSLVKLNSKAEKSSDDLRSTLEDCCSSHDGEKLKLFCHVCKQVICMSCFDDEHVTHQCSDVRLVEKELQRQMTNDINSLSVKLETSRQFTAHCERTKKILADKVFNVQNEARQEAERVRSSIDQDKELLLRKLSSGRKRLDEVNTEMESLKDHILQVEWSKCYAEELRSKGTAVDVATQWQAAKQVMEELLKFNHDASVSQLDTVRVKYTPSKSITDDSATNVVGEIKSNRKGNKFWVIYRVTL